tara:strand:- start:8825 stop:11050 length:2226 start_codon:yes stop_codon:yes gene_type:complete
MGYPEKLGGWEKLTSSTYLGSARALHNWIALDGSNYLGVGTHLKYYIEEGGGFNDITPLRLTTSAGDVTFSASTSKNFKSVSTAGSNDSTIVTVTEIGHGAVENDFVTFSGVDAAGLGSGGNITKDILEAEHKITAVIDASTYEITLGVAAGSTSLIASSSDSANGNTGSGTVAAYQINVGLDATVGGTGWGAGLYGGVSAGASEAAINEGGTFSNSDTTLTVSGGHGIVASDFILVDSEIMKVTNVSTNDLTVVRAHAGTGADSNVNTAGHGGSNDVLTQADGTTITVNTVTSNVATDAVTHADSSTVTLVKGNASAANDYFGWGDAASGGLTTTTQIRLWSHDNFGEDLLINARDSNIFYWDRSTNLSSRAVELSAFGGSGSRSVPRVAKQILVSDQDRHVIAFGCDSKGGSSDTQGDGVQDPLLIRFSTQESATLWFPDTTNTAGSLRLGAGSTFVQAVETKREILVYTDTALFSMRFIGGDFVFGLSQLASNITIAGPQAAASTEDVVFWMGIDNFYVYAGRTQQLPCTVKEKVFNDFNTSEADKIVSGVNSEFSEVFWFYPSASSTDNDRYVVYNYGEKVWYFGTLARTAWLDRGTRSFPIAAGSQFLYNHEIGFDDDGSAMTAFIESAGIDIGDGDQFSFIRRIVPDLTFIGSTSLSAPQAVFTIKSRRFPGADFSDTSSGTTVQTASAPVETYTEQLHVRSRGRSFALRVESTALGTKWKLGSPRVDLRPDGRR